MFYVVDELALTTCGNIPSKVDINSSEFPLTDLSFRKPTSEDILLYAFYTYVSSSVVGSGRK